MRFDAFTSGFYSFPSLNAASQLSMNYYPDLVEGAMPKGQNPGGAEKARMVLTPTPGLALYGTLPNAPVRALWAGENRLFAVGGAHFYEVKGPASFTDYGSIGNDNKPVQILSNGSEILLASAGYVYTAGASVTQCEFSTQLYDLVIDAITGGLTGDLGGIFDQSDVGCTVYITSGTGFIQQAQVITSVNGSGEAFGSSSWGTNGSTEGLGYEMLGNSPIPLSGLKIIFGMLVNLANPFTQLDVGATVTITGGAGFYTGPNVITEVMPSGQAAGTTSWGTEGSTGGTGSESRPAANMVQASYVAFLDQTFFAAQPGSAVVYYSAGGAGYNQPGIVWDPLNFFIKEAYPDSVAALMADHEQLYIFGSLESTEVWMDTGATGTPFQRNASYFVHYGCQAPYSVCRLGTGVAWIGGDVSRGQRVAYLSIGYIPQRVSTTAVEKAWLAYSTIDDAVAFTAVIDGHEFWVISFPTGNATWVYDVTLGEWHQRGSGFNGTTWNVWQGWTHACIGIGTTQEQHWVGDGSSGNIYSLSRSNTMDNGVAIHRRRRAPHLSNENKRRFYSLFELDVDTALADLDNAPPRVRWLRLGASRDRIFQIDDDGAGNLTLSYSDDRCLTFTARAAINMGSGNPALTITAAYMQLAEGSS
jgi:hypothetical protein